MGHIGCTLRHFLRGQCGGGDDDEISTGEHPRQAHLDVTGARWHVDEEVVELAPLHVAQKLFNRLSQHEATPHQGCFLVDEEPGRDHLEQTVTHDALIRKDFRLARFSVRPFDGVSLHPIGDSQETRHGESPDVGVEHADGEPGRCQRCREIDRD